jgi:ATP-dependent Clp protease adaptor protein ClpS
MSHAHTDAEVLERVKLKPPSMWTVVLHNDDFTPMEFVVIVLTQVFNLGQDAAVHVMLDVHNNGKAPVGRFTKEIAFAKAKRVIDLAEQCEHPLKATPEEI